MVRLLGIEQFDAWLDALITETTTALGHGAGVGAPEQSRGTSGVRSPKVTMCLFDDQSGYSLVLMRGAVEEAWRVTFQEKFERDRFFDWLRWQGARFGDFASSDEPPLDLEYRLLSEMWATEQAIILAGLAAHGRRPLLYWQGKTP